MNKKYKANIDQPAPSAEYIKKLNGHNAHTAGRFIFDFSLFLAMMGSASYLAAWGGLHSMVVFFVVLLAFLVNAFIADIRLENIKRLRAINGQECMAMVDFLKDAISPEVKQYAQQVKRMGREFTVAEFEALQDYENKYSSAQKEARARSFLYDNDILGVK
jgi:hypothetical protein